VAAEAKPQIEIANEELEAANAENAMRDAMRKMTLGFATTPRKAERKQREKKVRSVVDGRTLRAKGRTEQLNVKIKPEIKRALAARIAADGITVAESRAARHRENQVKNAE
jgi:hypothetical protein